MSLSPQDIQSALQAVQQHQRILVIPHANVDPDGLSSALACYSIFRAMGKEVTVICPDTLPEALEFLPGYDKLQQDLGDGQDFVITINLDDGVEIDKLRYTVEDSKVNIIVMSKKGSLKPNQVTLSPSGHKHDLLVVVDSADLALLGSAYTENMDLFSQVPILNIDHHISNTKYGQLQLIDPTAASATEVLYEWFTKVPEMRSHITADVATLLLTGLITDTRSFQNPNTTPRSLELAAQLLDLGARQQEIIQNIYKTKPLSTLRIWGRALNRIQVDPQSRIVWSAVSKDDLAEMDAKSKETHGILDELISTIPDADVYVLFTELEEGGLKASLRSSAAIDVSALAGQAFGGGGHPRAAGFRIRSFSNFQLAVLEAIQKLKEGMSTMRQQLTEAPSRPSPVPKQEPQKPTPAAQQKKAQSPSADTQLQSKSKRPSQDVLRDLTSEDEKAS